MADTDTATAMLTLGQFITREGITIKSTMVDRNPHMESTTRMDHYRCQLRRSFGSIRRSFTVTFSMGLAICHEPTAADVLDCLASDSSSVDQHTFEEWCSELGYDTDSRKAERTYHVCQQQAKQLRKFLGEDAYEVLLYHTERL